MALCWFDENWVRDHARAYGVYLALLYMRFEHLIPSMIAKNMPEQVEFIEWDVVREINKRLKGADAYKASEAAKSFIENFCNRTYDEEKGCLSDGAIDVLDAIEGTYYEIFKSACFKYFRRKAIHDDVVEEVKEFLKNVKMGRHGLSILASFSDAGSLDIIFADISTICEVLTGIYKDENEMTVDEKEKYGKILSSLLFSNIILYDHIIPAPYLEDEFIDKLLGSKREEIVPGVNAPLTTLRKYEGKKLTGELLEEVVVDVLEILGFRGILGMRPSRRIKLRSRGGGKIEVDVWAWKQAGPERLSIYVSCKNWNRVVDRSVVDEEFGRTLQLLEIPQLKILIAKKFSKSAKKTARSDGFFVIELKEISNAKEAFKLIYSRLRDVFMGMAALK